MYILLYCTSSPLSDPQYSSSIEQTLLAGTTIVCDRYAFSGIAFSASKIRPSSLSYPLLPYAWCRAPDSGLPSPDLTLFLAVSPAVQASRGGFGAERYENADTQRRVADVFERIADEVQGGGGRWEALDADLGEEEVREAVWRCVEAHGLVGGVEGPVEKLWDDKREESNAEALYM